VSTPMATELFFSVPVVVTPIVQGSVIVELIVDSPVPMSAMPIVSSPMA
jgi:hypothetical protein